MNKSKKILVISICIIALALLCALGYFLTAGGGFSDVATEQTTTVSLYFLDSTKTKLVEEKQEIVPKEGDEFLVDVVNLLIAGPRDSVEKKRVIPEGTELLSLSTHNSIATVDFSGSFYGETDIDNSLSAATVVKTLCETKRVLKVIILVDGQPLIGSDKIPLGALGADDIVYDGSKTSNNSVNLSLYFADENTAYLTREIRAVKQNDKEPTEKLAIAELMKGPVNGGTKLIPAEAKLISTEVKDGVCFVNFSKEFVDKHISGSSAETLAIYSIVNTLTELPAINKVQFLIEGQKSETFGEMIFDEPFTRNESLIK